MPAPLAARYFGLLRFA